MPAGRPTDLSEQLIKSARHYLTAYVDIGDVVPSVEGLAVYLGVAKRTLYNWAEGETDLHAEFVHVFEELKSKQARVLINKGLSGDFNPTITKLMLSKHGYIEKSETDLTTKGEKVTAINYITPNANNTDAGTEAGPGISGAVESGG